MGRVSRQAIDVGREEPAEVVHRPGEAQVLVARRERFPDARHPGHGGELDRPPQRHGAAAHGTARSCRRLATSGQETTTTTAPTTGGTTAAASMGDVTVSRHRPWNGAAFAESRVPAAIRSWPHRATSSVSPPTSATAASASRSARRAGAPWSVTSAAGRRAAARRRSGSVLRPARRCGRARGRVGPAPDRRPRGGRRRGGIRRSIRV